MTTVRKQAVMAGTAGLVLLAAGLGGGYWLAGGTGNATGSQAPNAAGTAERSEREVLYWYDPMVPDQRFEKPGKSPFMDMELVPKYADDASTTGVRIDPGVQQNVGIRTEIVETGTLAGHLRVPGTLTWDLRKESIVSTPVEAIISRLTVKTPFQSVRRGQPLATVLSPTWGSALAESRALAGASSSHARELQGAAQRRLRYLGLSDTTITGNGGVVLRAPRSGVVSEIMVSEGQAAMPGTPLFRINGTDTMWLEAAIPQAGAQGVRPGTPVTATVSAAPGRTFEGEVEALLPDIDATTRTQRARVVLRNEEGLLVPGMFAQLTLAPEQGREVPVIPSEALIVTGTDSRVIIVGPDGDFQPVRVTTGRSSGGRTEVLSGLEGGERVVTSGQFLIDSEASLSGALGRLQGPEGDDAHPAPPAQPGPAEASGHEGMQMPPQEADAPDKAGGQ
ncbi:efflux RND transporter periplasmic adaptor subunit [Lysobacter sp. A3-1-A15]|uniref:efflux RND transporter periplasmic adaptor subunit n=1 Tax=Novilysobacter viscosus TaxID=3098602 RepID=UPI002ED80EDB